MSLDVAAPDTLTFSRARNIERGWGPPATEDELRQLAVYTARMAPTMARLAEKMRMSEAKKARAIKALQIFEAMGPREQRRWRDRLPSELLTHYERTTARRRPVRREHRRSSRRVAGTRSSRGSPRRDEDPSEHDLAARAAVPA
jgi:hypothetical protein